MYWFLFYYVYVCIPVSCVGYLWKTEKNIRFSGARVTSSCGLSEVGARNSAQALGVSHVALLTMEPPLQPGPPGIICILMDACIKVGLEDQSAAWVELSNNYFPTSIFITRYGISTGIG